MQTLETREEVVAAVARASIQGNLGYFVGSGFSMALTQGTPRPAPGWMPLLGEVVESLNVTLTQVGATAPVAIPDPAAAFGKSAPEIASTLRDDLVVRLRPTARYQGMTDADLRLAAEYLIKSVIAQLCVFSPEPGAKKAVSAAFEGALPSWVVTTNYDELLEEVIPNSASLRPQEAILAPQGAVPIYHLHGHRRDPASIVILQEDYHSLLLTEPYRQARLSVAFAESLTVFLGYGIGDINVQLALKSSASFDLEKGELLGGTIIQAYYAAADGPPRDVDGLIQIPVSNVAKFLEEVAASRAALKQAEADRETQWATYFQTGRMPLSPIKRQERRLCLC